MTSTNTRHLRAVPTPHGESGSTGCSLVCQAKLSGAQAITVSVLTPVSVSTQPLIGVRVGGILLLVADWKALQSIRRAITQAAQLAPVAFGPEP